MNSEKKDYVTLKWGTVKSYNIQNKETWAIMEKYLDAGVSASAMTQRDTNEQKELLCQVLESIGEPVYLEWYAKYVSVEEAKEYIRNYDKS
jgi:HD-like signal output (HDOD) protein